MKFSLSLVTWAQILGALATGILGGKIYYHVHNHEIRLARPCQEAQKVCDDIAKDISVYLEKCVIQGQQVTKIVSAGPVMINLRGKVPCPDPESVFPEIQRHLSALLHFLDAAQSLSFWWHRGAQWRWELSRSQKESDAAAVKSPTCARDQEGLQKHAILRVGQRQSLSWRLCSGLLIPKESFHVVGQSLGNALDNISGCHILKAKSAKDLQSLLRYSLPKDALISNAHLEDLYNMMMLAQDARTSSQAHGFFLMHQQDLSRMSHIIWGKVVADQGRPLGIVFAKWPVDTLKQLIEKREKATGLSIKVACAREKPKGLAHCAVGSFGRNVFFVYVPAQDHEAFPWGEVFGAVAQWVLYMALIWAFMWFFSRKWRTLNALLRDLPLLEPEKGDMVVELAKSPFKEVRQVAQACFQVKSSLQRLSWPIPKHALAQDLSLGRDVKTSGRLTDVMFLAQETFLPPALWTHIELEHHVLSQVMEYLGALTREYGVDFVKRTPEGFLFQRVRGHAPFPDSVPSKESLSLSEGKTSDSRFSDSRYHWSFPLSYKTLLAQEINPFLRSQGYEELSCAIGLSRGVALLGPAGRWPCFSYELTGMCQVTATALAKVARLYSLEILADQEVYTAIRRHYALRPFARIMVGGKAEMTYQVLGHYGIGPMDASWADLITRTRWAWNAWEQKQWKTAWQGYEDLRLMDPKDPIALAMLPRCQSYIEHPPESGDPSALRLTQEPL